MMSSPLLEDREGQEPKIREKERRESPGRSRPGTLVVTCIAWKESPDPVGFTYRRCWGGNRVRREGGERERWRGRVGVSEQPSSTTHSGEGREER